MLIYLLFARKETPPKNMESLERYLSNNHTTMLSNTGAAPTFNSSTKPPPYLSNKTSDSSTHKPNEKVAPNKHPVKRNSSPDIDSNSAKYNSEIITAKKDVNNTKKTTSILKKPNNENDEKLHLNQ